MSVPDDAVSQVGPGKTSAARRRRLTAIGLMLFALLLFAILDALAKYLGRTYHPAQIAWSRYAFHLVIALVIMNPFTARHVYRTKRPGIQLVRSFLLALSTLLNFWAVQTLRLDQVITITFAVPLLVAIFAGPLLGEWVGPRRLVAIIVGFSGVLLVTRPGFGEWHPAYLLSLGNALAYALYNVLTRKVSAHDSAHTSFLYLPMFGTLVLGLFMPQVWVWPDAIGWAMLASTGALGGFGHYALIIAHGRAPAPVLAPFIYTQLMWMIALGWIVFGDRPDVWTLAGAGVVIGSGLYLFARERTVKGERDL